MFLFAYTLLANPMSSLYAANISSPAPETAEQEDNTPATQVGHRTSRGNPPALAGLASPVPWCPSLTHGSPSIRKPHHSRHPVARMNHLTEMPLSLHGVDVEVGTVMRRE